MRVEVFRSTVGRIGPHTPARVATRGHSISFDRNGQIRDAANVLNFLGAPLVLH